VPLQVDSKSRLSIGELAKRVGVRASAIRYYESIGVLPRAARMNGRRTYEPSEVERLRRIRLAQQAGFELTEIQSLERGLGKGSPPAAWRRLAATKLGEIDARVRRLEEMRGMLNAMLRCECESVAACPILTSSKAGR